MKNFLCKKQEIEKIESIRSLKKKESHKLIKNTRINALVDIFYLNKIYS